MRVMNKKRRETSLSYRSLTKSNFLKKNLQTAQEGEKTPHMSQLTFHLTLWGYSDQDVI